ncbi:MAG: hypothetical protein ICCCNLDF_02293 [Planctomycetes bacterium]|nr:hypothetical protein [Planctomycetota bacterium]
MLRSVFWVLLLVLSASLTSAGCASSRVPRSTSCGLVRHRSPLPIDFPGLTGDGHSNMASDLRHWVSVTVELLQETENLELIEEINDVTIYSNRTGNLKVKFEGYARSFEHGARYGYSGYSILVPGGRRDVTPDAKAQAIIDEIGANILHGVKNGKWVDDPLLKGGEGIGLDDVAPLFEMGVSLRTPDLRVREQRREQYSQTGGVLRVGVFYRDRFDEDIWVGVPTVFMFSGRTTSKVFALGEPYGTKVHTLTAELIDRIVELGKN